MGDQVEMMNSVQLKETIADLLAKVEGHRAGLAKQDKKIIVQDAEIRQLQARMVNLEYAVSRLVLVHQPESDHAERGPVRASPLS